MDNPINIVRIREEFNKLKEKYGLRNILVFLALFIILVLLIIPAARYFLKYRVYDPFHVQTKYFFTAGVKYEEKKYIDYAIGSFRRTLREKDKRFNLDMNDLYQFEAMFNLGVMYYSHKKEYPNALFYFNQYMELCEKKGIRNPHEKDIYTVVNFILAQDDSTKNIQAKEMKNRGNEAYFSKNFELALDLYKKALTFDAGYVEVYNNIATVYYEMNDFQNAVDYWKLTLLFDPDEIDICVNIALAYEGKLNKPRDAIKYFQKVMDKLNSKDPRYNAAKAKIMELDKRLQSEGKQ
ncbi:MAG: tetratricopeptide repeat protein [bacterium]|nr:tetratricopeptide repeat protein [bacterium]